MPGEHQPVMLPSRADRAGGIEMSDRHSRIRRLLVAATAVAVAVMMPLPVDAARAEDPPAEVTAAAIDPSQVTGLTSDTAAASCWEIKQLHPDATSGAYWLLTESMSAPQQFWCDQETDGGGWVKVGQGRQDWEYYAAGRGAASGLLQALPAANSGTTQLPTKLINGLMNAKPVTSLADGIRVRRALDTAGANWQEVTFKPAKSVGWSWALGAKWPLTSWRIGTATGSSGGTNSFGTGNGQLVVNTGNQDANQRYRWSFSYGSAVAGSPDASSYLWSNTAGGGSARPFSFVYIRPQVSTADFSYTRIPDTGTPKAEQPSVPDQNALSNPWGVTGLAGARQREGDVEVQDLVAVGNTMYVGGIFRYVQRDQAGTGRVEQPFLAAFNATTGEFIPTFRPVLNEAVLAIAPANSGRLAIGGKFTTVSGQPRAGFAIIDAATGALSGPQATLSNATSAGSVRVEDIKASGGDLFIGGSFTHTAGPTGSTRYTRNVSRINATTAMPVVGWQPEFNGTVNDLDVAANGKVFFAGFFTQIGTQVADRAAALPLSGSPVPDDWTPEWSSTNTYQRAVTTAGDRVYIGGSEHSMFSWDTNTYERISTHITDPKGDFQALAVAGDFLIGTSHSNWFLYEGATRWPSIGTAWTRADSTSWVSAWQIDGAKNPAIETFSPAITSRTGEAGWAAAVAPDRTIWTGGDFVSARVRSGSSWTGAFVRFGYTDGTAPNTPGNFRSTATTGSTVSLAWNAPSGGIGTGGSYQILRDDRVIATTTSTSITVPLGGERRYFVRAADRDGNLSASSPAVRIAGGNAAPVGKIQPTVSGLDVSFSGAGSTDDGSIVSYSWNFGDGATASGPTATHRYFSGGTYEVRLTLVDNLGAWSTTAYTLDLTQPRPTDGYGGRVFDDEPQAYWRMDETSGTRAADSATGARPATYQQGVTLGVGGIPGSTAASFDGTNDVMVADAQVAGPNTFSVETWFNTTTTRGGKLIGFGNAPSGTSSSYDRHIYMQNDGRLVFGVYSGGTFTITTPTAYNNGEWHHVVGTLSPAGMTFYVDGVLVGTNAQTVAQDYAGYWRVGGDTTWGSASAYFSGRLDEAAVYDRPLTAAEVWGHYAAGLSLPNAAPTASFTADSEELTVTVDGRGSTDLDGQIVSARWDFGDGSAPVNGLTASHDYAAPGAYSVTLTVTDDDGETGSVTKSVAIVTRPTDQYGGAVYDDRPWAYWRFDESDQTAATDSSRGGHPATYREGVTLGVAGIQPGTNAARFDGQNDLVAANDQIPGPQVFSTELWFNTTTTRGGKLIGFGRANQGLSSSYDRHVYMQDDGRLVFGVYDGTMRTVTSTASYNDGAWHHVVSTLSSAGLALYVDGQLVGTDPNTVAENFAGYWRVGGDTTWGSTSAYFDGQIDEVAIYERVLTAAKIANHYEIGSALPNQLPEAAFDASVSDLSVAFDGAASSDPDGTVASWAWNFGDGSSGSGEQVSHSYAAAGDYDVTLTVTDDAGATASRTQRVTVTEPVGTPTTTEVVARGSTLAYRYAAAAPPSDWMQRGFDASGWSTGVGPIGYGSTQIVTNLNPSATTSERPLTTYYRATFDVANVSRVLSLDLSAIGDDGVVVYVNGVEVGRQNMPTGTISHGTYAVSARRVTVAQNDLLTVEVPENLLVNGTNVIAAETHLNYRATPDTTFWATAALTELR